nr:MAG TPA: hypothetical protein [Caudoviricetes sp.]
MGQTTSLVEGSRRKQTRTGHLFHSCCRKHLRSTGNQE